MPEVLADLVFIGIGICFLFASIGYALICDRL